MDEKIYVVTQGGRTDYNYKEFFVDTVTDKDDIDVTTCCPGSVAYIISTGAVYILNNEKEWIEQ